MTLAYRVVTAGIRAAIRVLCRIDDAQLAKVPDRGPLILLSNHINFMEAPLLYTHLQPRPLAGFAKAETWRSPFLGLLADLWGAIPLHRGQADLPALRRALQAVEEGRILCVAPEGTRSGHGRLGQGNPGIVFLALRSGADLVPMVSYGTEQFWGNLRRLRRTDIHIVVGQAFSLDPGDARVDGALRRRMTDEIMYQMAALLPPAYRGAYSDLSQATETYIRFPPGAESNLRRA